MSGGHEACSLHLSALTLVMVACLGDHEAGQIGVCGLALEGLEPGSEVREHQGRHGLALALVPGEDRQKKSGRRSSPGVGVRDFMEPGGS